MANSNNKPTSGLIFNAFGVAKKLSKTGLSVMNHVVPGTVSRLSHPGYDPKVIQGSAREKADFEKKFYASPQQMIRENLPQMSSQLLGRHYKKINQVASFISPDLNDKLADYFFDKLNDLVSQLSSVDAMLDEVGAKNLAELAKDPERAQRISLALANQNKIIAALQGILTGATGVIGAAIDVPTSLALALRSVYQTGRAYGFELKVEDHAVVEYIFKQIDMGSVAEKQALLAAVRAFSSVLQEHDINQLQQLLGSSNDTELLKNWLVNEDGSLKWSWLNYLPQLHIFSKISPLASMGIGAVYSCKLVDDATNKAQQVFCAARQFLIQHPEQNIATLSAYEKSVALLAQATPKLLADESVVALAPSELKLDQDIEVSDNQAISKVMIKKKTDVVKMDETEKGQQVQQGLEELAEKVVEAHEPVEPQKPALPLEEPILDEDDQPDEAQQLKAENTPQSAVESAPKHESAAVKKKVTKKKS